MGRPLTLHPTGTAAPGRERAHSRPDPAAAMASPPPPPDGAEAVVRPLTGLALLALVLAAAGLLDSRPGDGPKLAFSWLTGALLGFVMQRSRFCFHCNLRDFIDRREPAGLLAILAALAAGSLGYWLIFGAWLPDPGAGRLPPDAHIGAVSLPLAVAAFIFGLGMAISGSCLSGHLYRLGEGSPTAPFAIVGTAAGFALGFRVWPHAWEAGIREAPVIWLPAHLGYAGALALQLALFAAAAIWLLRRVGHAPPLVSPPPLSSPRVSPPVSPLAALFTDRWPGWLGGLAVGALATAAYLRVEPLGVTAEIGSLARTAMTALDWLPDRLDGLDRLRGCATQVRDSLLSTNGVFVAALVLGALAGGIGAGQFRPRRPRWGEVGRGLGGGVLLGLGAMIALGCTVGTLLSGVMAGAVSGLVFLVAAAAGVWLGLRLMAAAAGAGS